MCHFWGFFAFALYALRFLYLYLLWFMFHRVDLPCAVAVKSIKRA